MSDDESLLPHSLSHEEDDDVEVAPATAAAAKKALSAWHEGLEAKIAAAGKSMHALITEIIVPNPNVRIFSGKETPMSVVRTTGSTRAAAKKNPDLFTGNVFDMLVAGRIGDTNAYRYGYVKGGPPDVVANFTPIAEGQLGHFHDPNVDFKKFAMDTSHDQATLVKLRAPNGTEFSFPRYDECYVISSVRKSEKPRGSSKAPRKTKKDAVVSTPLSELVAQSRVYLTRLQAAPSLTGVPVIFERGPHFDALRKALGTERFPAMRSETVDGPRSVPPTFGLNVAKALELHMNLVLVNLPPSPDDGGGEAASEFRHVYGQQLTKLDRAKSGATWDTETLVHAILVSRMIPQFYTTPAVRVLAERGHALSEKSIGTFFSDFVQSDRSASHCASTILQYAMACQVMAELVLVQHPLLKLAVALIAFASQIYKLGSIGTARFDAGDVDAPVLTCALTGTAIVPGEAFYVIHARSRPTEALPVGQEMIAVVATRCFTAEVPLFVVRAHCSEDVVARSSVHSLLLAKSRRRAAAATAHGHYLRPCRACCSCACC